MYSHDLQTCDWPRNVNQIHCNSSAAIPTNSGNSLITKTTTLRPRTRTTSKNQDYSYKPIKIENSYDLSGIVAQNNDQEEGARSGRSYAQSGPEQKIYGKDFISGR